MGPHLDDVSAPLLKQPTTPQSVPDHQYVSGYSHPDPGSYSNAHGLAGRPQAVYGVPAYQYHDGPGHHHVGSSTQLAPPMEHAAMVYAHTSMPEYIACPSCLQVVVPRPHKEAGLCTWLAVGSLCLLGCWPVFWLPFCCCTSLKDDVFDCPSCSQELFRVRH